MKHVFAIATAIALAVTAGVAHAEPTPGPLSEPLTAWQRLPSIEAAIAVDPLDGPEEITAKAEIIADRRDALLAAQAKLARDCGEIGEAAAGVRRQTEALRDLASVSGGRELKLRQRQQDAHARQREMDRMLRTCAESKAGIEMLLARTAALLEEYMKRAHTVRREETGK